MNTNQPRQPKGQPTGGEFAAKSQSNDEIGSLAPGESGQTAGQTADRIVDGAIETMVVNQRYSEDWVRERIRHETGNSGYALNAMSALVAKRLEERPGIEKSSRRLGNRDVIHYAKRK